MRTNTPQSPFQPGPRLRKRLNQVHGAHDPRDPTLVHDEDPVDAPPGHHAGDLRERIARHGDDHERVHQVPYGAEFQVGGRPRDIRDFADVFIVGGTVIQIAFSSTGPGDVRKRKDPNRGSRFVDDRYARNPPAREQIQGFPDARFRR